MSDSAAPCPMWQGNGIAQRIPRTVLEVDARSRAGHGSLHRVLQLATLPPLVGRLIGGTGRGQ